jgi:DNA replication and repair protein RecF
MILSSVQLKNFRSHKNTNIKFSEKLNFILGGNGEGKTSILESIYYLCTTKAINAKSDSEVVKFNENEFEILGFFKNLTDNEVRIFFNLAESKKYYFKNGKQINRSSEIIGKFPVVLLTPGDHSITQGAPADRRKFVDSVISQASKTYLNLIIDYNRTLRQRSSLLNHLKENRKNFISYDGEINAWTEKLISSGTEIIRHRLKFVEEFSSYVSNSYKKILDENELPSISYFFLDGIKDVDIEKRFREMLNNRKEEEFRRATNLVGPHRDDFIFEINNTNLRSFGSQGQHKTFQVALRFAEFFYLKERTSETPIFLLDDVFGELDVKRAVKISEYLKQVGQAFITLTDFTNFSFLKQNREDTIIKLHAGEVAYV